MTEALRQLCGLSLFCGIALGLMPEGGVKKAASIACTVVLVMTVLLPLGTLDISQYSLELAKYREMGEQLEERGDAVRDSMSRTVIEQEAYVDGFWDELVGFTRSMFNSAFKTNPWLERAIMTGITRVSKESIFSDLKVVTTTSDEYAESFGFTEKEVFIVLDAYGLSKSVARTGMYNSEFSVSGTPLFHFIISVAPLGYFTIISVTSARYELPLKLAAKL